MLRLVLAMYSPSTRLLAVLEILQARREISGSDLAARLEVDVRTVRRYITMLQDMGVPVESSRGRYGAYRLRAGFRLPPLLFTDDEVMAVTVGLLAGRQTGLAGDPVAVEGALAKIERVLPEDMRVQVRAVADNLVLDLPVAVEPAVHDALATLSRAIHDSSRVWISHRGRDADEAIYREVDPYGLVHRNGQSYLVGYCHLREDVRVFRLDRILEIESRSETFDRPVGFDPLEQLLQTLSYVPRAWPVEVLLKTTLAVALRRVPAGVANLTETPDGVLLRCQTEDLDWFVRVLLWVNCPMVVVQPPELKQALARLAEDLQATSTA